MLGSDEIKTMIAALGCGIGAEDFDICETPLPPHHHHDRRRRRRVAHSYAAPDVLLPAVACDHRTRVHLHRPAAAVPRQARQVGNLHQGRTRPRVVSHQARGRSARGSHPFDRTGNCRRRSREAPAQDDRSPEVPAHGGASWASTRDRRGARGCGSRSRIFRRQRQARRFVRRADHVRRGPSPSDATRSTTAICCMWTIVRTATRGSTRSASTS